VRDKLTPKQRMFVNEYLVDLNGTNAAIRAGYSQDTAYAIASENLTKPEISKEIDRKILERERRTELTADYVLSTIHETIERCKQGEAVLDREGRETGEWKFDPNSVLKGCELAGKHLKLFTDKLEVNGQIQHEYIDISRLTEGDLASLERLVESACGPQSSKSATDQG